MAGKDLPRNAKRTTAGSTPIDRSDQGPPGDSGELLRRYVRGDERAAEEIFHRYMSRLVRLARSRLSPKLAARLDAEDVVMSAYRSFFIRARTGHFTWERSGDLWRLLVEITLHKLYRQVGRHRAARRSVDVEVAFGGDEPSVWQALDRGPSPEVVVAAADELSLVMAQLPPLARRVLELRLQGEVLADIARAIDRSERTTRRLLELAKECLRKRLDEASLRRFDRRHAHSQAELRPERGRGIRKASSVPRKEPDETLDQFAPLSFNDYVLHQHLGTGATGKVYRATHKPTGQQVAVKYLRKSYIGELDVVARFIKEAGTVMRLRHPGIVAMHGLGRTPNAGFFIVMDWIEGGDLSRQIGRSTVQPSDAIRWVFQAAEAIEFAHRSGVVHCDLKPSNLLLDRHGQVHVTDFGLARSLRGQEDTTDTIAGTPAFMAPEQVDVTWGDIGPRTDVYGLGAVLVNLLTGRPPYPGPRVGQVMARVASRRPVKIPPRLRDRLGPKMVAVCERCLAKRPADRFCSAAELAGALSDLSSSQAPRP